MLICCDMLKMLFIIAVVLGAHLVSGLPLDDIETETTFSRQPVTNVSQFSYQVLISEFEEGPKCGGVLISEGFIITSASCVLEFGGIMKFLDAAMLYGGGTSLLVDLGDVLDAMIHPKYTVNPIAYDVALIKYIHDDKGPRLDPATINDTVTDPQTCIFTSWWTEPGSWPERMVWLPLAVEDCSAPESDLFCFSEEIEFFKNELGCPIVCGGVLAGLVPRGGGKRAIDLRADFSWITDAMLHLTTTTEAPATTETTEETKLYLIQILQKLENITLDKPEPESFGHHLESWSNQIVIPLGYVLFAMVIFFFVLLFFIILFTVVLVYYSKK